MTQPHISFVIPVLNAERDIERCLRSIQQLRLPARPSPADPAQAGYEVIIIDNGSTDRTQQIIHALGFEYTVVTQANVSTLRNIGAARAHGEYLAFVDADVAVSPDWLVHGLRVFADPADSADPQVVASGCFPAIPPNATWVQKVWDIQQRGRSHRPQPRPVAWLPSMNLIVRRTAFEAVGGFDEQLETTEDVDLCYRLGQHGIILQNVTMEAIHWGEPPDLATFWRKEVWRAKGSLRGVWQHGLRWDELPSIGYPLYILCAVVLFGVSSFFDVFYRQFVMIPMTLGVLILPAAVLATHSVHRAKQPAALLHLCFLYLVYGFARAYAAMKGQSK